MKQSAIAAAVAGLMTTVACSTHSAPQAPASSATPTFTEVTITGCLVQGSGPTVFILENARADNDTSSAPGSYLLMPESSSVRLETQLNHEVRIKGMRDDAPQPVVMPGERPDERDVPRLTARALKMIVDKCLTPSGVR